MRTAAIHLADFPCVLEERRNPGLGGVPLIISDQERRKTVVFCSAVARSLGVYPGMPLRRALSLCPNGVFLEADPLGYRSAWDEVLDSLEGISPTVNHGGLGQAYLDTTGLTVSLRERAPTWRSGARPRARSRRISGGRRHRRREVHGFSCCCGWRRWGGDRRPSGP
ncbi:MAG: hypothetical protein GEU75_17230 [Dehalococcoidia bacterium]|nr:hypothetical protein [Dehalococcoidia bacterium]